MAWSVSTFIDGKFELSFHKDELDLIEEIETLESDVGLCRDTGRNVKWMIFDIRSRQEDVIGFQHFDSFGNFVSVEFHDFLTLEGV